MQLLNTKTYQRGYSLLGRVVKLIFPGPVEAFLDPGVCPESHHSRQQLWREGLCVLHPTYDVADHLGISLQREERRGQMDTEGRRFQKQCTRPSGVGGCLFGVGLRDPHRMLQQEGQKEDGARFPWKSCPPFALLVLLLPFLLEQDGVLVQPTSCQHILLIRRQPSWHYIWAAPLGCRKKSR